MNETQDLAAQNIDIINNIMPQNEVLNTQNKMPINQNLALAFKNAGIEIQSIDNRKDIIDYSKFINDLNQYFILQKNTCEGLMKQYETKDERVVSNIAIINEHNEKIKELFNIVLAFFTNPPSKEFLELSNYSALFQKLYIDYKKFSDNAASLKLNEMAQNHKEIFEKHLDEIEHFETKVNDRLEHVASKYKSFAENMLKTLNEQLTSIQNQINTYQRIREQYEKTTKYLTRGLYALIILCSVLCVGAGGLLGVIVFKTL